MKLEYIFYLLIFLGSINFNLLKLISIWVYENSIKPIGVYIPSHDEWALTEVKSFSFERIVNLHEITVYVCLNNLLLKNRDESNTNREGLTDYYK